MASFYIILQSMEKSESMSMLENFAVCIENFKVKDVFRICHASIFFMEFALTHDFWIITHVQCVNLMSSESWDVGESLRMCRRCPLQNQALEVFWLQAWVLLYKAKTEFGSNSPLSSTNLCHSVMPVVKKMQVKTNSLLETGRNNLQCGDPVSSTLPTDSSTHRALN